jgi:protoporphyrinogen IX oxidase
MTAIRLFQPRPMAGAFFCAARSWVLACGLALSSQRRRHRRAWAHRGADIIAPMMSLYPWVKALHLIFVASWFAGLFYLPRLFVNLAMVPADSHAERERLLLMARKLYRFASLLMVPALLLGLWLWLGFGLWKGSGNGWLHAKLLLVIAAIGYHHACRSLLRKFEQFTNKRSERWFRVFNEAAVVIFAVIVVLVVVKPF